MQGDERSQVMEKLQLSAPQKTSSFSWHCPQWPSPVCVHLQVADPTHTPVSYSECLELCSSTTADLTGSNFRHWLVRCMLRGTVILQRLVWCGFGWRSPPVDASKEIIVAVRIRMLCFGWALINGSLESNSQRLRNRTLPDRSLNN